MTGVSGALLSLDVLSTLPADANVRTIARRLRTALADALRTVGPASAARMVLGAQVLPIVRLLGLDVSIERDAASEVAGLLRKSDNAIARIAVGSWGGDLGRLTSIASRATSHDLRWTIVTNGALLRIVDGTRVHARRTLDIDLQRIDDDENALCMVVRLFETDAAGRLATLERCAVDSDAHRTAVGRSLQLGVEQALAQLIAGLTGRRRSTPAFLDAALAEALTVV